METSRVLKCNCHLKPSVIREKARALKEHKWDKSRVILTANNGVAMVVLVKEDFINKVQDLLAQRDTSRPLVADTTNKQKNKLINTLRTIKAVGGLEDNSQKITSKWHSLPPPQIL